MDSNLDKHIQTVLESNLTVKEKEKLLNELRKSLSPELNRWPLRFAIIALCLIGLSIPILYSFAMKTGKDIPAGLLSIGSAAVGSLGTFISFFSQKRAAYNQTPSKSKSNISPAESL